MRELGNQLSLGGNQWIYYDSSYIRYNGTGASTIAGKRVISKVDNLRFYDATSWQDKDVAGSVDAGLDHHNIKYTIAKVNHTNFT